MMTRVSKRFIFLSFHPAINQSKPTELLSHVTKDLSGEAGNPELPIECRKTHGLPRKPLGQPVLVNLRRSGNAAVQDVCNQMARSNATHHRPEHALRRQRVEQAGRISDDEPTRMRGARRHAPSHVGAARSAKPCQTAQIRRYSAAISMRPATVRMGIRHRGNGMIVAAYLSRKRGEAVSSVAA